MRSVSRKINENYKKSYKKSKKILTYVLDIFTIALSSNLLKLLNLQGGLSSY
jgi:membrane-anchored glycerophosphoryl diester phosphodiesterase (GDPDase)